MGIHFARHAVRGPPRVGDAQGAAGVLAAAHGFQVGHLALGLVDVEDGAAILRGLAYQRTACAVVTTILQFVQSFNEDGVSLALTDVTYYSSHIISKCEGVGCFWLQKYTFLF